MDKEDFRNKIAEVIIAYQDALTKLFNTLTDEELAMVPEICAMGHENCTGFRVTEWDEVAQYAQAALGWRVFDRKATQYMNVTNPDAIMFCKSCETDCNFAEHSELEQKVSDTIMRIHEMSRDALIEEVIQLRGLK